MWKYRSETIFALAIAFALKGLFHPDGASVAGLLLFLSAHYVDRFFSAERADAKVIAKITAMEGELTFVKQELGRLSMSVGIRSMKQ